MYISLTLWINFSYLLCTLAKLFSPSGYPRRSYRASRSFSSKAKVVSSTWEKNKIYFGKRKSSFFTGWMLKRSSLIFSVLHLYLFIYLARTKRTFSDRCLWSDEIKNSVWKDTRFTHFINLLSPSTPPPLGIEPSAPKANALPFELSFLDMFYKWWYYLDLDRFKPGSPSKTRL